MVPLEKVQRRPEAPPERPARRAKRAGEATPRRRPRERPERERTESERTTTALPPGHVRKKATGELGKVQSVDAKAGTATVRWLRSGSSSTVSLSAISRR
jgi:hypothetical protein